MKNLMYRATAEVFLMREKLRDLRSNKSGASMIEYSLLLGLITAAIILLIVAVGGKVKFAWSLINSVWNTA